MKQEREINLLKMQLETQKKINKIQESMIKDYQEVMIPLYIKNESNALRLLLMRH